MIKRLGIVILASVFIGLACSAMAQDSAPTLRLPHIFGDNMVLQSGKSTPVWGWAAPEQDVTVTFGAQKVSAKANDKGKWTTALTNLAQSKDSASLTVKSGDQELVLKNIIVGDVWLGSGQSNMEYSVGGTLDAQKFIADANCPNMRLFRVSMDWNEKPQEDLKGEWVVCTPETAASFGATLYFFGREIQDKTGTPLGLVQSAVGGQRIEPFIAREGYDSTPELLDIAFNIKALAMRKRQVTEDAVGKIDEIDAWLKATREAKAQNKQGPLFPVLYGWGDAQPPHRSTMLFNANIYPMIPFAIKGVVWYQGEGNEFEQESYAIKMRALVNGWRECWKMPDMPFYYAQIAGWFEPDNKPEGVAGVGWHKVRMGQLLALSTLTHSGMAVTTDISDGDIHPKNKLDVGKRLALWALKNEYGKKDIYPSGPLFKSMAIKGNKAIIDFDYIGSGLMTGEKKGMEPVREVKNGALKRFSMAGEDKKWYWANAKIEGSKVVVSCPDVPKPVAVRYGFTMNPSDANLYNKEGLPASTFRTDNWLIGWGGY